MRVRRSYDMDDVDAMRETLRAELIEQAVIEARCSRRAVADGWPEGYGGFSMKRAAWATVLALLLVLPGCGGASAETRGLYAIEVARCTANERTIIDRTGTTEAEDVEAMEIERARCAAALEGIYP